jgi:hypothetical protein
MVFWFIFTKKISRNISKFKCFGINNIHLEGGELQA